MYYSLIIFFVLGVFVGFLIKAKKSDGRFIVEEDEENNLTVKLDVDFNPFEIRNHKQVVFTVYKVKMEE